MNYNVPLGRLSIARGEWRDYTCKEFSDYLKKYVETHQWLWADVVILVSNCTRSFLLAICTLHQIPQNTFTRVYVSVWTHVCVYTDVARYGWCNSTLSPETFPISLPFHYDNMQLGALNSTKMTPDTNSRLNQIIVWREPDIVSVDRVLVKVHKAKFPFVYVWGLTSLVFLSPFKANLWNLWEKIKLQICFPHIPAQSTQP